MPIRPKRSRFVNVVLNFCSEFQYNSSSQFLHTHKKKKNIDMMVCHEGHLAMIGLPCRGFSAKIYRNDYIGISHKDLKLNWQNSKVYD